MNDASADPRRRPTPPGERWRRAAVLALVLVCIAVTWRGFALHVWTRAFPRFDRVDLSLVGRLTPLSLDACLPLLSFMTAVAVALHTWRRVGWPVQPTVTTAAAGTLLLLVSTAVQGLSLAADIGFTSGVALLGALFGLLLTVGGARLVRAYAATLVLLVFVVPLPLIWVAELTLTLKLSAAGAAAWMVAAFSGLDATVVGSTVRLPPATFGAPPRVMSIDDACSGLRSLATLTWVACVFACVRPLSLPRRLLVIAAALPLALGCNVLRIAALLLAADTLGFDAVADDAPLHHALGVATFALALATLFLLERPTQVSRAPTAVGVRLSPLRWAPSGAMPAALLAVVAVLSFAGPAPATGRTAPAIDWSPLAQPVTIDGRRYRSITLPVPERVRAMLGTDAIWYARFVADDDRAAFDVLMVFHATARQAVHPPEVCLRAAGQQLVPAGVVPIGPDGAEFRRLLGERDGARVEHLYTYRVGDRYTVNFLAHQALATLGAWAGDDAGVALLRLSAAGDDADTLARDAAEHLLPLLDTLLP